MKGTKHITRQVAGNWLVVCTTNGELTRADYKFAFCPSCGEQISEG